MPGPGPGPAGGGRVAGSVGQAGDRVAPRPHGPPAVKHLETEITEARSGITLARYPLQYCNKCFSMSFLPPSTHSPDCQQEEETCGHEVCGCDEDQLLLVHSEVHSEVGADTLARLNVLADTLVWLCPAWCSPGSENKQFYKFHCGNKLFR